ncbi:hypothetical protein DIPPA_16658 [Diplonema papillatum]|nr:hypothetical protein DIPPA_16658 [Diplonema papillatum]
MSHFRDVACGKLAVTKMVINLKLEGATLRFLWYDRAETFEGDFRNSTEHPLTSAKLLEQIQTVCARVVSHFRDVACGKLAVTKMVINLKFDGATRLHFLWCESLRLAVKTHPATGQPLLPRPAQIGPKAQAFSLANKLNLPSRTQQGEEFRVCTFCSKDWAVVDMVEVKYHTLLSAYDQIKTYGKHCSIPIARMKQRWLGLKEKTVAAASAVLKAKEAAVPIDSHSFTKPLNADRGLLAHIDERLLLSDPMLALSKATEEWEERQTRNFGDDDAASARESRERDKGKASIPWFVLKLHPYITSKDWEHAKHRDDFLDLTALSCPLCFLSLCRGLTSEDTIKRYNRSIASKPKLSSIDEVPTALSRRIFIGPDDRRVKPQSRSRLLVPCTVQVKPTKLPPVEGTTEGPRAASGNGMLPPESPSRRRGSPPLELRVGTAPAAAEGRNESSGDGADRGMELTWGPALDSVCVSDAGGGGGARESRNLRPGSATLSLPASPTSPGTPGGAAAFIYESDGEEPASPRSAPRRTLRSVSIVVDDFSSPKVTAQRHPQPGFCAPDEQDDAAALENDFLTERLATVSKWKRKSRASLSPEDALQGARLSVASPSRSRLLAHERLHTTTLRQPRGSNVSVGSCYSSLYSTRFRQQQAKQVQDAPALRRQPVCISPVPCCLRGDKLASTAPAWRAAASAGGGSEPFCTYARPTYARSKLLALARRTDAVQQVQKVVPATVMRVATA